MRKRLFVMKVICKSKAEDDTFLCPDCEHFFPHERTDDCDDSYCPEIDDCVCVPLPFEWEMKEIIREEDEKKRS